MYYYVSGTVAHVEPYLAVIDCGGVGYACRTTAYELLEELELLPPGKAVKVHGVLPDAEVGEELDLVPLLDLGEGVGRGAAGGAHPPPRPPPPPCPPASTRSPRT